MEQVTSFRLEEEEINFLKQFAKESKESKGELIRKLIKKGRILFAIDMYKEKKISLGKAAKLAGVCISDMIDLLGEFGINSNVTIEDFRESLINAKKLKFAK